MDRDDLDGLAEMLPEDVELHEPAEAVDHDALPRDPCQGPFRPDPESGPLPLRVGEAADRLVRGPDPPLRRLLPHDVPHPDDRESVFGRDPEEFLLPAAGHPRNAEDLHGSGNRRAT